VKRGIILNEGINTAIASIGHLDLLGVVDAGYPVPLGVARIDLALRQGMPAFMDVLNTILEDFIVESFIIARETIDSSPHRAEEIREALGRCPEEVVPHVEFKQCMKQAKAVIRTGEFTPFSNVILVSGVDLPKWWKNKK
jgi:D-ribose pyranase